MSPFQRQLDKTRLDISRKVRQLRKDRRFTQAELAHMLGMSQNRLSEIERGGGSFTAEQLLTIIRIFNIAPSYFSSAPAPIEDELQNALARLGASHLSENPDALPSERLRNSLSVLRETLVSADSPRQITSLAPILVKNIDNLNLWKLRAQLAEMGLERRLGWVLQSTQDALHIELSRELPRSLKQRYVMADTIIESLLGAHPWPEAKIEDVLDKDIRSSKARQEVQKERSAVAARWGLLTRLRTEDFVDALRAANELR